MNKEEAKELVYYYRQHPEEVAAMRLEIGANHPAIRYMEALEMRMPSWRREPSIAPAPSKNRDEQLQAINEIAQLSQDLGMYE